MVFFVKKMASLGGIAKRPRYSGPAAGFSLHSSPSSAAAAAVAAANAKLYSQSLPQRKDKEKRDKYIPKFKQEISDIMRGYGDCETPLLDSIILVEKIVLSQMRSLLDEVIGVAVRRCGRPQPLQRDFEFMMRNSTTKLYRFQKYLKDLELKRRYEDMVNGRPMTYSEDFDEDNFQEPEEVEEKYDEEKTRRVFRANRISLLLDSKQYTEYNDARRTSFHYRNSATVKAKLYKIISPPPDAIISVHVYTILGYLVHETIATIVDYAILTRLNSSNRDVHPLNRLSSAGMWEHSVTLFVSVLFERNRIDFVFYNFLGMSSAMMHACPEVTQGRALDGFEPITVQEIHEAMRRHSSGYQRPLGMYRNSMNRRNSKPYLAF